MKLSDTVHIPASPETVWRALNDPDVLKSAIPGSKTIEKISDTEFRASAAVTFGPVKAVFEGKVTLSDLDPPKAYRISGEGVGGAAGFAKGSAFVRLTPAASGTDLSYDVEASVGGKIAQIGQRFIDQAAKKLADDFFARFGAAVSALSTAEGPPVVAPSKVPPEQESPAPPEELHAMPAADQPQKRPDILLVPDPGDDAQLRKGLLRKSLILATVVIAVVVIIILSYRRS